ncbi:DNA polymerase zeta [Geosmithia morbida]|uniref:DNA polymerase n=1 Tax=Geosmithia morbida TaxID=1094350 RepID=A0A9P4YRT8_9HYPO|nr:DNA polymerase zeta [Geosmithia morbida]KAF4119849.1 DNA polymerase zeta [Geosmithia morbida]
MKDKELFRVRLNCIDHYQATATRYDPQLRNDIRPSQDSKGPKVPVIRVFGSTQTGQKVCAHIHGAFPYLFVEYDGSLAPEDVGLYIYRLHMSINHALSVSYRKDQHGDDPQFVARITLVKGVPFYGYHVGYRFFLKIYMYNPIVMTRLADLLQQGVIMKQIFQPYEAHLQYLLQFMIDYNLYGCDYLDSRKVRFRTPVPEPNHDGLSPHMWHSQSISPELVTDDLSLPRVSHCSIEVDICVQDIVNRKTVKERPLHHDFIERNNPLPDDAKLVSSMAGLWKDEEKRRKRQMGPSKKPNSSPFPPEALVTMSADPRQSQQSMGWINEEEYRAEVQKLVEDEEKSLKEDVTFDSFAKPTAGQETIKTALQSVEDLYPSTLLPILGLPNLSQEAFDLTSSIEVDEKNITQVQVGDEDFFQDDSDEEEALRQLVEERSTKTTRDTPARDPKLAAQDYDPPSPLSDETPIRDRELPLGVCISGLQTGQVPEIPINQELLDAAEEGCYIFPKRKPGKIGPVPVFSLKRAAEGSPDSPGIAKRPKVSSATSPTPGPPPGQDDMSLSQKKHSDTLAIRSQSSPEDFRSAQRPGDTPKRVLDFAIVKGPSPSGASPRPRGSQKQSSQPDETPTGAKQVRLGPTSSFLGSDMDTSFGPLSSPHRLGLAEMENQSQQLVRTAASSSQASRTFVFAARPPNPASAMASLRDYNIPEVIYRDAFYSVEKDVPPQPREYAGREFRLEGNTAPFLPPFDPSGNSPATWGEKDPDRTLDKTVLQAGLRQQVRSCSWRSWELGKPPPTYDEVADWWKAEQKKVMERKQKGVGYQAMPNRWLSQIDGPTQKNKHGFAFSEKQKSTSVQHEVQYMSTMSVEIHINSREKLVPDPEEDEIQCIFWSLKSDEAALDSQDPTAAIQSGIVVLSADGVVARRVQQMSKIPVIEENSELGLMVRTMEIVREHDPDVLTGYEVHGSSWGYMIERAKVKYDYDLCDELSRMKSQSHGKFGKANDSWGFTNTSSIHITGRHMINIWRAMRAELNLLQYTMENVVWHLLHRRIPHYSWQTLTTWYTSGRPRDLNKLLDYYQVRARLDIEILEANELVPRTSEQARLLGVDFFSVFSRGSQFKVESIMFRIAKPENFLLVSPSRKQVGGQNALECLPLVMEPQSSFYTSPVLVLDFQSLYPSVMIAYNYCYSTFLGRITNWRGTSKMGFSEYKRQQGLLALVKDHINIAPNGMMYVKASMRRSLLAKMLTEILETRVMVKSGMKKDGDDKRLQQLLNNRQLALKLLANVTYGYTSASFSGRMPCSEIADSIVQTGRETLERAIALIHSVERWGAEVVYGDTDSLFVHLKGKTREQAFDIGMEMAKAVTEVNPRPVKLKFEKVYHPCVLLAKKRYVGYKYESREQTEPEFDAKGIETVRRDGTPAEQKIEEKALRLLFDTSDLSRVKSYFQQQCDKIMRGAVSVQDFCFAREVRLGTYSDKSASTAPAGALISTRRMLRDARAEPQYGERVPYVVVTGAPGARLIDRCVAPEDLTANPHWRLDAEYYMTKNLIPPLERIFNLVGANVRSWYDDMPKVQRIIRNVSSDPRRKTTLESYMRSNHCLVCARRFTSPSPSFADSRDDNLENKNSMLCPPCRSSTARSLISLQARLSTEQRRYRDVLSVCRSCSGLPPLDHVSCDSKDCPVFWTRTKQLATLRQETAVTEPVIRSLVQSIDSSALEW